jgi:hypothetical protein
LQKLGIFNKDITVERLILLKAGLLNQRTWIGGLQYPYRALIPFLTLACLRMKRVEEDAGLDNMVDLDLKPVIIDVLADAVNVLSAMKPTPTAGK